MCEKNGQVHYSRCAVFKEFTEGAFHKLYLLSYMKESNNCFSHGGVSWIHGVKRSGKSLHLHATDGLQSQGFDILDPLESRSQLVRHHHLRLRLPFRQEAAKFVPECLYSACYNNSAICFWQKVQTTANDLFLSPPQEAIEKIEHGGSIGAFRVAMFSLWFISRQLVGISGAKVERRGSEIQWKTEKKIIQSLYTIMVVYVGGWVFAMFSILLLQMLTLSPELEYTIQICLGCNVAFSTGCNYYILFWRSTLYREVFLQQLHMLAKMVPCLKKNPTPTEALFVVREKERILIVNKIISPWKFSQAVAITVSFLAKRFLVVTVERTCQLDRSLEISITHVPVF